MPQPRYRNVSLKPAQHRKVFNQRSSLGTRANPTQLLFHRRRRSQHHGSRGHRIRRVRTRRGTLSFPRWRRVKSPFQPLCSTCDTNTDRHCTGGNSEESAATCERTDRDYNISIRIGMLFVVLAASSIGTLLEPARKPVLTRSRCLWPHPHGDIHAGQVQPIPHRPQAIRHRRHHLNRIRPCTRLFFKIPFRPR